MSEQKQVDPTVDLAQLGRKKKGSGIGAYLGRILGGPRELPLATATELGRVLGSVLPPSEPRLAPVCQLGEGGMATVEAFADRALRRKIAIKRLHPELEAEREELKAFVREAQILAQLEHPHIVPVHDFGQGEDGRPFFSMKLVGGRTLGEVVQELPDEPLDRSTLLDLLEIVLKVCDALAFAHRLGVLHLDLKPANIMVGDFGQVYLMDWGIARLTSRGAEGVSSSFPGDRGRTILGTPAFMSPEQASGGDLDERTDVFALGGVLYYLLSRQPPFDGASIEEILARARSCSFAPLRELASPSRELDRIVSRALAASPEDRYPGVNELKEDLVAFVRGGALPTAHFEQGQVIVAEGEIGDEAYLVVTGSCEVFKSSGGQRTVIRTLGPGECFGETAILAAAPRSASVVALEDTVVQVVSREELQEELGIVSPWMSVFLRSLAERFLERELPTGG